MDLKVPSDADVVIKPAFIVSADQKVINRLKRREDFIFPVSFEIGVRPLLEPDVIDDSLLEIWDSGLTIYYAVIYASMFDWNIMISRGEFLSSWFYASVNACLKKGQISPCKVYDGLLLWNHFDTTKISDEHWVGTDPFRTKVLTDGIFRLSRDATGKQCLCIGNLPQPVSFSSTSRIIVRYKPY